ncbi:MAG TPA: DUF3570 domain-containing protein, partial [Polyangiaceae bacterium]|nr:DUF3570 domain-containing protein [Polyangiaceae bacterium]
RAVATLALGLAALLPTTAARAGEPPPVAPATETAAATQSSAGDLASLRDDDSPGFRVERFEFATAFFYQEGHGLQSQAGPVDGRGSERAWIIEPMATMRLRQSDSVVHDVLFAVDIVSAASPDALDAVAHASEYNESFTGEVTTTIQTSKEFSFGARYGAHAEEPLRSVTAGPILTFHLFDDNTVLSASATVVADGFDDLRVDGHDRGFLSRTTFSGNFAWSQILSPTTLFSLSLGLTEQWGTLAQTWNSVISYRAPGKDGPSIQRLGEKFPVTRNRNALEAHLAQHIPATHTTVKGRYRFYFDENSVFAHTTEIEVDQYIVPWLVLTGRYRFHVQPAIDFWVPYVIGNPASPTPRTSDSDLEDFVAREIGAKLTFMRDQAPAALRDTDSFTLGYSHYFRTNDLAVDMVIAGYGRSF